MNKLERASRKLTQILRHKIIDYNLTVNSEGYVKLNDIRNLNLKELKYISNDDIYTIVETNEKKRLEIKLINNEIYIRATQGHNLHVGSLISNDDALEEIFTDYPAQYIYHGTQKKYVDSILQTGLNRGERKHIHLVDTVELDKQTSGFRSTSNAIITIDMKKCMEDGIKFYKSKNDVILTEGDNGNILPKYIIV